MRISREFTATLFRYPGKGGWTFVPVPEDCAPPVTQGWGRAPVTVTCHGQTWDSSTWRGKDGQTLLPLPAKRRSGKDYGDEVTVTLEFDLP